jgi:hypothetical protein
LYSPGSLHHVDNSLAFRNHITRTNDTLKPTHYKDTNENVVHEARHKTQSRSSNTRLLLPTFKMNNQCLLRQIHVMHLKEKHPSYKHADYLNASIADMDVTASDREVLFKWGYETIAACNGVSRITAVKALSYFDRFLSTCAPAAEQALKDKADFQLAFVACFVIALKVHSGFSVESEFVSSVVCGECTVPRKSTRWKC